MGNLSQEALRRPGGNSWPTLLFLYCCSRDTASNKTAPRRVFAKAEGRWLLSDCNVTRGRQQPSNETRRRQHLYTPELQPCGLTGTEPDGISPDVLQLTISTLVLVQRYTGNAAPYTDLCCHQAVLSSSNSIVQESNRSLMTMSRPGQRMWMCPRWGAQGQRTFEQLAACESHRVEEHWLFCSLDWCAYVRIEVILLFENPWTNAHTWPPSRASVAAGWCGRDHIARLYIAGPRKIGGRYLKRNSPGRKGSTVSGSNTYVHEDLKEVWSSSWSSSAPGSASAELRCNSSKVAMTEQLKVVAQSFWPSLSDFRGSF